MEEELKSFDQHHLDNNSISKLEVSDADVEYITDHNYPFIQIINPDAEFGNKFSLHLINAANGWVIHDYGGAISTSAPYTQDARNACSIPNQIAVTKEIVKLINWPSVELIAGTPMMKFLLWVEARLSLIGYTPSEKDKKRREFLRKLGLAVGKPPEEPTFSTAR